MQATGLPADRSGADNEMRMRRGLSCGVVG